MAWRLLLLLGMKANAKDGEATMRTKRKHTHEWLPEDDGRYVCHCGATKLIAAKDAAALWEA